MAEKLKRLFAVQSDKEGEYSREMTDLSRAFGILLHIATNSESSTVASNICEMVSVLSGNTHATALYNHVYVVNVQLEP